MRIKLREICYKYKHALWLIYFPIMVWQFDMLEVRNVSVDIWVSSWLDSYIPYIHQFVIPYMLWFPFVGVTLTIMGFRDKEQFYKMLASLYIGMTFCNLIYLLIPHGQPLRVALSQNEINVFDRLVYMLYSSDTPTNCSPSIHVIFSMATMVAICSSALYRNNIFAKTSAHILNILIILSTMFIKQHSIIDVILGLAFYAVIYVVIYKVNWESRLKAAKLMLSRQKQNEFRY